VEVLVADDTVAPLHEPLLTEELTVKRRQTGEIFVKVFLPLLAVLASVFALPALAQVPSGHYDAGAALEPDIQALAFLRIPFGDQKKAATPRIGFGVFADCKGLTARLSSAGEAACGSQAVRSLEISRAIYGRDWLISFSGDTRWVGFARWVPGLGFVRDNRSGPVFSGPALHGPPN
jgi:hypothetical protein